MAVVVAGVVAGTGCSAPPDRPRTVQVRVGDVRLQAEVADDDEERAAGLRGRDGVPPGTGMVFRYDDPRPVRFTMSEVDYPLVAVFARDGRVVAVEQMPPCAASVADCPTYGPDEPVDTVVEAAPESLPSAAPGDELEDDD